MGEHTAILVGTAASIGILHTIVGVDHSLPFILLARAQRWSLRKLWSVTALCGVGHVASSVLLGVVGIAIGAALEELQWIQTARGHLGAWLLIGFGLAYATWSIVRTHRSRAHSHAHGHGDGIVHVHEHTHTDAHTHAHAQRATRLTAVALFIIFVLGPCELLIPLIMAPAASHDWVGAGWVVATFGGATVLTMLTLVTIGHLGLQWRGWLFLERHVHTVAGLLVALSGGAIQVLGI